MLREYTNAHVLCLGEARGVILALRLHLDAIPVIVILGIAALLGLLNGCSTMFCGHGCGNRFELHLIRPGRKTVLR